MRVAILTLSRRVARGIREDVGGDAVAQRVRREGMEVVERRVIGDDDKILAWHLVRLSDHPKVDLILTTGGTGLSVHDVTPEATLSVLEKRLSAMEWVMFQAGLQKTPHAMLSRAVAGSRNKTLIINLPGSPKGAIENLEAVLPAIPHAIRVLQAQQVQDDEHRAPQPEQQKDKS
ncbi:MAG: MogA/MoaB family molybdenum cofactor biosynthesis protein [Calditrichaeota bacterium]|nr:MAG: MogA/MoaB family molybdenum cofactor biosynthesis protein [Calditrichota bacterium]